MVLAGGKGTRLLPYTTILPKPLMPVGDRPILEHVLTQLGRAGFSDITISVGHLAELIQVFFGTGERWGVKITYAIEDEPLGTIGPPGLYPPTWGENFLVINGDILSDLDMQALWQDHIDFGAPRSRSPLIGAKWISTSACCATTAPAASTISSKSRSCRMTFRWASISSTAAAWILFPEARPLASTGWS